MNNTQQAGNSAAPACNCPRCKECKREEQLEAVKRAIESFKKGQ